VAQDVQHVLRQYDDAPDREPMHGQKGQIRHSLSTDEKRVKRQLQRSKTADLEDPVVTQSHTATIAELLGQAERAETHAQRQALVLQAEQLRTAQLQAQDEASGFRPQAARIRDTLVPGRVHERTTADSDWLLEMATTASLDEASQDMLAQASLWFGRVSDEVKSYKGEFDEQARNLGRRIASQHGDVAEQAERVFLDETARLHALGVKAGQIKLAADDDSDDDDEDDGGGFAYSASHPAQEDPDAPRLSTAATLHKIAGNPVDDLKEGSDVEGLEQASDQVRQQYTSASGLSQVAEHGVPQETFTDLQMPPAAADTSSYRAPAIQELNQTSPVVPVNDPGLGQTNDEGVNADNGVSGQRDAAHPSAGFPVSGSLNKESSMAQEHAQCPTCGGQGKVAVRTLDPRQAYSGLPQIDEIIGNDDHPGTAVAPGQAEGYPSQVAFPIVWNDQNVPQTIQQAEQQIRSRPQGVGGAPGAPVGPGGAVTAGHPGSPGLHEQPGPELAAWPAHPGRPGLA
jgi:hypothetical protein